MSCTPQEALKLLQNHARLYGAFLKNEKIMELADTWAETVQKCLPESKKCEEKPFCDQCDSRNEYCPKENKNDKCECKCHHPSTETHTVEPGDQRCKFQHDWRVSGGNTYWECFRCGKHKKPENVGVSTIVKKLQDTKDLDLGYGKLEEPKPECVHDWKTQIPGKFGKTWEYCKKCGVVLNGQNIKFWSFYKPKDVKHECEHKWKTHFHGVDLCSGIRKGPDKLTCDDCHIELPLPKDAKPECEVMPCGQKNMEEAFNHWYKNVAFKSPSDYYTKQEVSDKILAILEKHHETHRGIQAEEKEFRRELFMWLSSPDLYSKEGYIKYNDFISVIESLKKKFL